MTQTVIGIFDNSTQAQTAVQQLTGSGISRDQIDIANCSTTDTTTTDRYDDNDDDSIGGFFRSLFGGDDDADARKYSTVARRGCVVTVHAQSDEEARRAADLLDDYGAVDVDEQAARYGYTGSAGTTGNMSTAGGALASGAGIAGMPGSTTGTTGMGSTTGGMTGTNDMTGLTGTADTTGMGGTTGLGSTTGMGGTTGITSDTDYNRTNLDTDYNRTNLDTDRLDTDRIDTDRAIPIIEENLQVGKREVETGGVRLRSRIIERPVEEHLRLRQERVNVVRNPVNRPVSDGELNTFREGTIEMTEHAEVPVVSKEARVVEEISLNREVEEHDEVIRDTVRKTDVDIENLGSTNTGTPGLDNTSGLDLDNDRRRTDLDGDRSTAL